MPEEVRRDFGRRLNLAQRGELPPNTKPWQGLVSGVFEMVEEYYGDAYRGVYFARYDGVVYVLHAFQKKASSGKKTSRRDIQAVEIALKSAIEDYKIDFKKRG